MPYAETTRPTTGQQVVNGVKFVANVVIVPGASQIVEGKVVEGIAYAGSGLVARSLLPGLLGPIGWLAVALDSYSYSASGRHLWESQPATGATSPVQPTAE